MSSSEATTYIDAITYKQMEDAEDYFQGYIPAWLDTAMNLDNSIFSVCLGTLRTLQHVHKFNNGKQCYDFLCSITEKQTFLILSSKIDDKLLNDFIVLPQLKYIYQFGNEAIFKKEDLKLVEITSIQALYQHLSKSSRYTIEEDNDTDFASLNSITTVRSIEDLNDDARIFIFYQLLIEILLRLPKTSQIENQFYAFCIEKTNDNLAQQNIFKNRMKSYTPEQAISWYTGTCFLHKLLNRTCRLGNIKDMFKLAFFMVDLNAQLKILHNEYFYSFDEKIHVYRGRPMSTIEFNKLKNSIGDLVVTKSFLSTTIKRDAACFYAGVDSGKVDFIPAILHLIIDKHRNETKSFARLLYNSDIRWDDEVLISIGTVFRITERNEENGIQEFTLFRGDKEKNIEFETEKAFQDQTKENNDFFQANSPNDIDKDYKEMADIFLYSNNQTKKSIQETTPSTNIKEISTGPNPTAINPLECQLSVLDGRFKRVYKQMKMLEDITDVFIVDRGPVYESSLSSSNSNSITVNFHENIIIEGRILPKLDPYCRRSFRIRFSLEYNYPFEPPMLKVLDPIYHPNITKDGKICMKEFNKLETYHPGILLTDLIKALEDLISATSFDERYIINNEAYNEYKFNRNIYNEKVLDYVLRFGSPRS